MNPETYTSIVTHEMRQTIITKLFKETYNGNSITKQKLADSLGIKYQQLVYQLMSHLKEFWTVVGEEKVRGTRMEFIAPKDPYGIYICVGKNRKLFMVDPIAGLYGPLSDVGIRCDSCSEEEYKHCIISLVEKGIITEELSEKDLEILALNGRMERRPLDMGLIKAVKELATGGGCTLTIPCEKCMYMQKKRLIQLHDSV